MNPQEPPHEMNRRKFIQTSAATIAASTLAVRTAGAQDAPGDVQLDRRHEVPGMTYRQLGRTNFMSSRLVFGCGAALAGGKAVRLLDQAYEAGINFYDVGSNVYYKGSEHHLGPFMKAHRGEIWVSSKAPVRMPIDYKLGAPLTTEQGKTIAEYWTGLLEASLKDLDTDYVDAYYIMSVGHPELVKCEPLYEAFLKAKQAGKVGHFGVSTHKRAQDVLEAMIETGWYDLAMVAVTPVGWYDWESKSILTGTPPLRELRPVLDRARESGIGLIGMKAARFLASGSAGGKSDSGAFDHIYDRRALDAPLTPFQRTYAYVLAHGVDVVNSDMQNFEHFEANVAAVQQTETYFA
jgi:aryl-alcohol dehydrogenase-like predicted oxidoreductase